MTQVTKRFNTAYQLATMAYPEGNHQQLTKLAKLIAVGNSKEAAYARRDAEYRAQINVMKPLTDILVTLVQSDPPDRSPLDFQDYQRMLDAGLINKAWDGPQVEST